MKISLHRRSQGVTLLGMMTMVLVISFSVMLIIKMMPPYMQNFAVKDALKDISKEPNASLMTKAKVKDKIERRLQVDGINAVITNNLVVEKVGGKMQWSLKYENRVPVVGNIDFVFKFDEQVQLE